MKISILIISGFTMSEKLRITVTDSAENNLN